jgi:ABC-type multidrug transport system fused ATPase/permease subunit
MKITLRQYTTLLHAYLAPNWLRALGLALLLSGSIALQLVNPQIVRGFIDVAASAGASEALLRAALLFIIIAAAQQGVSMLATYASESLGWVTTNALRADLATHCLRLDLPFHNAHTPGEMIERIDGDVTALATFFSQFTIQVVGNGLLLVGVVALLFREDWRVGLAMGGFSAIALAALAGLRGIAVPHWAAERESSAALFGYLEERLAGIEDIRSCGAVEYVMRRFYALNRVWMARSVKAGLMMTIMVNSTSTWFFLGPVMALAVGALLYLRGGATIGTVYMIFYYGSMLVNPINTITTQFQALQHAGAAIGRINLLLGERSRLTTPETGAPPADDVPMNGPLAVEFDGVSFGYADGAPDGTQESGAEGGHATRPTALRDISFCLPPGRVLGLLGRTGGGKTTLTRLLFRFYDPDAGAVRLGRDLTPGAMVDLRGLRPATVRHLVGMVTQEIQLFNATVRDNLTFFDSAADDERIAAALADLGMGPWLQALPQGLDTVLGAGGAGLSAGEAQLLAFARVFLQDPGVVVLDEASSRLDPATEALVERAVERLVRGRTAIIIAHRLATVQHVDDIMVLEEGHIVEHGPRAALANNPASRFYALLQMGLEKVTE